MSDPIFSNPSFVALITMALIFFDRFLTVLQHRQYTKLSTPNYRTYPVNTSEGNPLLQRDIEQGKLFSLPHSVFAFIVGILIGWIQNDMTAVSRPIFLGCIWGIFLIVNTAHISNLFAWVASRRGMHGQVAMHQRTAYLIQAGRYFAITLFLVILSVVSGSLVIVGVAIAGLISTLRQFIWMRRIPQISADDRPPSSTVGDGRD